MTFNLATILRESARANPTKTAAILGGQPMSYAELDAASDRFAVGLDRRGLRPGDAVYVGGGAPRARIEGRGEAFVAQPGRR